MHIIQYQKNENGIGEDYEFDANLVDKNGKQIGALNHQPTAGGESRLVQSPLGDLWLTALNVDSDPVLFRFNGFAFASLSSNCNFGDYDSGSRQGDCGFDC